MDTFFDCLNVRNTFDGNNKRNENLQPYRKASDERFKVVIIYKVFDIICISMFQWLRHTFLGYFDEWEAEISSMTTLKKKQKAAMQLSRETLEGLKITGM